MEHSVSSTSHSDPSLDPNINGSIGESPHPSQTIQPPPSLARGVDEEYEEEEKRNNTTFVPGIDDSSEKKAGRRKINIEFIEDKSRRHITFSKRKAGIMKKAFELSTLTGTQVLLLVASETGHVYTFATPKLQPLITKAEGKNLIQACLNSSDIPPLNPMQTAMQLAAEESAILRQQQAQQVQQQQQQYLNAMSAHQASTQADVYDPEKQKEQAKQGYPQTAQSMANALGYSPAGFNPNMMGYMMGSAGMMPGARYAYPSTPQAYAMAQPSVANQQRVTASLALQSLPQVPVQMQHHPGMTMQPSGQPVQPDN
eukprot:TRINITY_DN4423_c0_g1_i2.p1 TRINITY_DN4423_c0_g1~~TRINITY_DN4423_c0_g1_i2.p1  ORF type:complete len:313 (-),score=103.64 TRINITY_DN4423_c0_g1_i2:199-1137(-)